MKKVLILALILPLVLMLGIVNATQYKNPLNMEIENDDFLSNSTFDIKSDRANYRLLKNVVYFKVTNLTDNKETIPISVFFDDAVEVTFFGEWKQLERITPIYEMVNVDNFILIDDLNNFISCTASGYSEFDSTYCLEETQELQHTKDTISQYDGWKKTKAQQWQQPNPVLVPEKFNPEGSLSNVTIGKNETKYFIFEFQAPLNSKGAFYICAGEECLDPTFEPDFDFKREITLTNVAGTNEVIRLDLNVDSLGGSVGDFFEASANDGNSVIFTNCAETEQLFHQKLYWSAVDENSGFDLNTGLEDTCVFVYYGTDVNTLDQSSPNDVYDFYDDFEDNTLVNPTWTANAGNWSAAGGRMQWDNGAGANTIRSDLGSSLSYGDGFSMRSQIFNGCGGSCGFGISNNADPRAGVGDADGYELIANVGTGLLRIQEMVNGNNSGMQAGTTYFWTLGDPMEMRRNSAGRFTLHLDNNPASLVAGVDASTTTGRYVYAIHGSVTSEQFEFISYTLNFNDESSFSIGAEEPVIVAIDFNVTLNVFQGTGAVMDLNNLVIDFNVDAYDQPDVNSPLIIQDVNIGHYEVTISKAGWSDSNSFILIITDANQTLTKTIDKFVYPKMFQFLKPEPFVSSSKTYLTVETFLFDVNAGVDVDADVSCSFWTATTNALTADVFFKLESSNNASDWNTLIESTRSFGASTVAGSIYIVSGDFFVPDGNNFFRLQQKQQALGAVFDVTTNGLICHLITELDQNNNLIVEAFSEQSDSTSSATFESVDVSNNFNPNFNSIFYGYGSLNYSQAVSGGTCNLKFEIPQSNFVSEEFPRTVSAGESGIGGLAAFLPDLNANSAFDVNAFMKTSAGTCTIDRRFHLMQLNQKPDQFAKMDLNGTTTASTSYEQLGTVKLSNEDVTADYRAFSSTSFSCSEDDCLFELFMNAKNGSYDVNSLVMKRESNGAGTIGVSIFQYDFNNLSVADFNVSIWGRTDKGTITIEGGVTTIIRSTLGTTLLPNPPQIPDINVPINGSVVSGSVVDYNCFSTDPNGDALQYDVNIIVRDTNTLALNLEDIGDGNGTFNSTALDNGVYSIECRVTEVTAEAFSANFDNSGYEFTINNPAVPIVTVNFPNGGESFNLNAVSTVDINIAINDPGSGSWLVDLNYSTSASEGTGIVIVKDQNTALAGITCVGAAGIFDCIYSWDITSVPVGTYFIDVNVTDDTNLSNFDASNASFTIVITPPGEGYERFYAPGDDRQDLIDKNKFVNPELVTDQSGVLRRSEESNTLLIGIIILLGVIIIIAIFAILQRRRK